jgi:hypothetical protein
MTGVAAREETSMSQFLYVYRINPGARQAATGTAEAAQQRMQAWMKWFAELEAKGHLKDRGQPLEVGGKVVRGSKSVTDGPYAEAKDVVGGYSIVEARDIDHAVELSNGCPVFLSEGSVEVRPVMKINY